MLKQKKNINLKYLYKNCKRYRNIFETKNSILNKMLFLSIPTKLQSLTFKVTSNNLFCSLLQNGKTILNSSAGKEKIKVSKKTQKFSSKILLTSFFYKLKKKLSGTTVYINIIAALKVKFLILRLLKKFIKTKKQTLLINLEHKKCFNGCKQKKKKRKKQRGFRIFK